MKQEGLSPTDYILIKEEETCFTKQNLRSKDDTTRASFTPEELEKILSLC